MMPLNEHPEDAILLAFRAGDLSQKEHQQTQSHLKTCLRCRQVSEKFAQLLISAAVNDDINAFQSKRIQRGLDEKLDKLTLAQRTHWAPPQVAAALVLAVFSGATFAMTAGGWTPFSPSQQTLRPHDKALHDKAFSQELPESTPPKLAPKPLQDSVNSKKETAGAPAKEPHPQEVAPLEKIRFTALAALSPVNKRPHKTQPTSKNKSQAAPRTAQQMHSTQQAATTQVTTRKRPSSQQSTKERAAPTQKPVFEKEQIHPRVAVLLGTPSAKEAALKGQAQAQAQVPGTPLWTDVGDLFSLAGQSQDAMNAYVQALSGSGAEKARSRLDSLLADEPSRSKTLLEVIDAHQMAKSSAEGMRLRCELGLVHEGGRTAVEACLNFGKTHPAHRSVRILLLAAGGRAEHRLHDEVLAIKLYSLALSLPQYGRMLSTRALLARARCYEKLGQHPKAQADLSMFLRLEPEAAHKKNVRELANRLKVPLAP